MFQKILLLPSFAFLWFSAIAQNNNGQIDMLEELAQKQTVAIPMSDGTHIMTDVFLPITSDSLMVTFNLLGNNVTLQLIPKNTQLVIYPTQKDALGTNIPNPNPYQLPLLLTRTPYDRRGIGAAGGALTLLGYAYVSQDTRGRFESEGVDIPMYSDGWAKTPYSTNAPVLDITNNNDPHNSLRHQDGWDSYQYLLNNLRKDYDLNNDGNPETNATICNGTIGAVGASAFAISHFQMSAAHKINPDSAGLRGMLAAVATTEHYRHTFYHNGVFREGLIYEWVRGQIFDLEPDSNSVDLSLNNAIHSPADYNQITNQAVMDLSLDHISKLNYGGNASFAYPYSHLRHQMDVSHAPVDALGNGQMNGQFSRYSNIDVPTYHLTGWFDIFASGQIESYFNIKNALASRNNRRQKLIIGPWAHQTVTARKTGDVTYPTNVADVIGFAGDGFDFNNPAGLDIGAILQAEPLSFIRYALNENGFVKLGEPVVRIPVSQVWQNAGQGIRVRVPSQNYDISITELLNFLAGQSGLPAITAMVDFGLGANQVSLPIPAIPAQLPIAVSGAIQPPTPVNFEAIPDIRFYVMGATDTAGNTLGAGNYWAATDRFPIDAGATAWTNLYLHQNGDANTTLPSFDEGSRDYTHDPNAPITTCGGGNMFESTPDNSRISQGQMNYKDSSVTVLTMDNNSVISFETAALNDTMSVIGYPKATLFAKSQPLSVTNGETDTDFFVRILDVCPDGRELYVVEGAINARARDYARSIYNGTEDPTATFSNININQFYELNFEMLPIAYTFGIGHKIKILISSSNYPRYQSNPNVPIAQGEFFRRQPNDNKTYTYQGQNYSPRIATNSITFSTTSPSRIELPVYNGQVMSVAETSNTQNHSSFSISPNPTADIITLNFNNLSDYQIRLYNNLGQLSQQHFTAASSSTQLNLSDLPAGLYHVEVLDNKTQKAQTQNVIKR
jgi:predicted acyl esterase